ncbi:MAG: DUF721 domain-containing protein [Alphaproteobacteria bacterium]|nr:DUF721 domain-containing protein [Alphaproteobacteria bacterium]
MAIPARARRAVSVPTDLDPEIEARAAALLERRRGRAPIKPAPSAGYHAGALVRPLLAKAGVGVGELQRRWREIVGEQIARATAPEKLANGVLTIRAPGAIAPFVQHQAPLILERCQLAGAKVKSVLIRQGTPAPPPAKTRARALTAAEEAAVAERVSNVGGPRLQAALARLGRAMSRR